MSSKVFRDAVHNMISLHRERKEAAADPTEWGDAMLLDLIDTQELQRLRRIRQLGPAHMVYPSAEHSRFSHALGTMHLAKRILRTLPLADGRLLDKELMLAVKVAALFHDVGHGPYSHVFEHLMPGIENHEVWGWRILAGEGNPRDVIIKHCHRLKIDGDGFFAQLQGIWGHNPPQGEVHLGKQIISSQLDADRMDYLLRDACFTGVSYGSYDLEWLLHSLRAEQVDGSLRLCVDLAKGPVALESYISARDHMYRQVYDHKTVRAYEALLIHIFQLLVWIKKVDGSWPPGMPNQMAGFLNGVLSPEQKPELSDYLALDDTLFDFCFGQWAVLKPQSAGQAELRWKCSLFRDRQPVYRRVFWQNIRSDVITDSAMAKIVENFFSKRAEELLDVKDVDGSIRKIPLRLLVYVDSLDRAPYSHLQYTSGRSEPVYVVSGSRVVRPAEEISDLISFLGKNNRRQVRVFVDPQAEKTVLNMVEQELNQLL
ncbi:MAG: HD domain-containing protein [Magnetococcales bacterium]|nr:HD domain-containing protein [Magnetococcales bacterium]